MKTPPPEDVRRRVLKNEAAACEAKGDDMNDESKSSQMNQTFFIQCVHSSIWQRRVGISYAQVLTFDQMRTKSS